ncbi:hypothetical protein DSLASN_42210 [Desulfoluna limicola]|uniref:Uncharacterized protein n=1 Tax=Desulfoluna limicola TaxID=2810562 RepID=A0ABM7PMU6_9BACT|nr:hypothetical protein DSLASN_42210 [Desulfoluna limicola]
MFYRVIVKHWCDRTGVGVCGAGRKDRHGQTPVSLQMWTDGGREVLPSWRKGGGLVPLKLFKTML